MKKSWFVFYREFIKYGAKKIIFCPAPESRRPKILSAELIAAFHETTFSEDETSDKEDDTGLEPISDKNFKNVTEFTDKKINAKKDKNEDNRGESFPPIICETKTGIICTKSNEKNLALEISGLTNAEPITEKIIAKYLEKEIELEKTTLVEISDEKKQLRNDENIRQGLKNKFFLLKFS